MDIPRRLISPPSHIGSILRFFSHLQSSFEDAFQTAAQWHEKPMLVLRKGFTMTDISHVVGAIVISAFLALNVVAMYLYLRRRVSLDPRSEINHAINARFDSTDELHDFHEQEIASVNARADAALGRYKQELAGAVAAMDPIHASKYASPNRSFSEIIK